MHPQKEWALGFLLETFAAWVELEVETQNDGYSKDHTQRVNIEDDGFDSAVHIYLTSIGERRLSTKYDHASIDMAWFGVSVNDYFARRRYPTKFEPPKPTVKKAPVKEPEKTNGKTPTLTLLHQKMVNQLGGDTDIMCAGDCGNSLKPRFDYAREHGTCPNVFEWKENGKFYCGACYGNLPHNQHQAPLVSQMKLKAKFVKAS